MPCDLDSFVPVMVAKRRRITSNNKEVVMAPTTMTDVSPVRVALRDWINDLHSMRHCLPEDQKRAWPVECGGSFLEVVQRCFRRPDRLLADSLAFCKALGIIARDATTEDFQKKFLAMKAGLCFPVPPTPNVSKKLLELAMHFLD